MVRVGGTGARVVSSFRGVGPGSIPALPRDDSESSVRGWQ